MRALPKVNVYYWLALVAASVFGTNTGDFLSDYLHLGHVKGLPFLLMAVAVIFLAEKFSPVASVFYFWAAIIVIRTAATNIADSTHDIGLYGILGVAALFAAFVGAVRRYANASSETSVTATPRVDGFYWLVMALAGIVGTLVGDLSSFCFGILTYGAAHIAGFAPQGFSSAWVIIGHVIATGFFGAGAFAMLQRYEIADLARPYPYWIMVALIRTAGTALGDYISKTSLGLTGATLIDGTLFVSALIIFYIVIPQNTISRQPS